MTLETHASYVNWGLNELTAKFVVRRFPFWQVKVHFKTGCWGRGFLLVFCITCKSLIFESLKTEMKGVAFLLQILPWLLPVWGSNSLYFYAHLEISRHDENLAFLKIRCTLLLMLTKTMLFRIFTFSYAYPANLSIIAQSFLDNIFNSLLPACRSSEDYVFKLHYITEDKLMVTHARRAREASRR